MAVLIPENLETLKAGGRISPAVASLAGLLKIVPLLNICHGSIDLQDKVRTLKKAYQRGVEVVTQGVDLKIMNGWSSMLLIKKKVRCVKKC